MKFSTSVLFTVVTSSAMASSDASASDIPPSSTVVSVPSSLSSAVVDLNDPVQKSIISIIGRVLTGGSLFAGSPVNNKIKRDLESIVSASYAPTATNAQASSSITPSVQIDLNDPVQKNIISDINNFLKNAVSGIVKRDEAASSADQLAQLVANLAAAVSSASASSASVTPSATATNVKRDFDIESAASYTPSATISSYAAYASASSSAVVDANDPVQKAIWNIIFRLPLNFGGRNNNKLKRDLESLISVPTGTSSESSVSVDLSDTVQQAPTATNDQASSSATSSVQIDLSDPVQKNIISDIDNFLKNAVSGIVKRDDAASSADQLAQLVANLAAAVSSASASSASVTPSATATNVKRDFDIESTASYTPSATISSYAAYASASSSAVVDPNDPVQKSIWSIIGKLAPSIHGLFGGHNNNKLKRDLESLISVPTGTSASASASESSVSVDLSDPVQKAIWGDIGKTVMGTISKRDVDGLTDAQRKYLNYWSMQNFGCGMVNGRRSVLEISCKREVTNVDQLDQLVAELAAAASSAASASAISSTAISSLL
ncbi:unnamed protein product [Ambrosiozyma monospora]|uniref:Unnamed protein product n=1 Tax=Ambrosiozyma monospora TaxID=43982 RepID=A0A9W6YY69_AMBMO|nr:unnamed protein product [Ambrosiozyma monospora]